MSYAAERAAASAGQVPAWVAEAAAMHGVGFESPESGESADSGVADSSDPERAKAARRQQRLAERSIASTIHEMMSVAEVRAVIYRWLEACRAFAAQDFPYGTAIDPLQLARNAAHREVAQFILADLHRSAAEQYLLMLKENAVKENA